MLDTATKRRIDNARDILVGKLPDPKSQVEQITIALIYKFMDDMDQDALKLGGKTTFFSGEFKKYAWDKIFDPKMSGIELVTTYGEAIQKMNQNPHIPQLFRDMFKNAYLPYRDPETLKSFLKVIGEFEYDHSERLGDAFEYLLSVLGSQGEAGQFRTPRHIIDFMIELIDPRKNETILDPACGTAGFLISAYRHILKHNSKDFDVNNDPKAFEANGVKLEEIIINNKRYRGDKLKSDDKERITKNIIGYDISPDMVRLSLVNMYLHGLRNPRIVEYDTLTNEDKWGENADVIMANPPFMSPKGGIRPHKRFSIESNRSEVLFVDYIVEHLTPQGRSAIIVPEGVIFQSQTTHKALRQMLIEKNYLVGVISLPAGLFNPYSGVKTSILWIDKTLAKKTDKILFVKIENDGFDLGAQRRPIKQNDLPEAFRAIQAYKTSLTSGGEFDAKKWQNIFSIEKIKIGETGDYNLSVDRYKPVQTFENQQWPMVKLDELFLEIKNGKNVEQLDEIGKFRVSRIQTISQWNIDLNKTKWTNDPVEINDFLEEGDILLSHINSIDHLAKSALFTGISDKLVHGINLLRFRPNKSIIYPNFAWWIFKSNAFITKARSFAQKAVNQASIKTSDLKQIEIPLPPLEIQKRIAVELDGYQNIILGAQQIITNWKPIIAIDPKWKKVKLGDVCDIFGGGTPSRTVSEYWNGDIPWISSRYFTDDHKIEGFEGITKKGLENSSSKIAPKNSTILITRVSVGRFAIADKDYAINQDLTALVPKNRAINSGYLWIISELVAERIKQSATGIGVVGVTRDFVIEQEIPLPPIETQEQIVAKIEAERTLIDSSKKLVEIYEKKIKNCIAKIWGE